MEKTMKSTIRNSIWVASILVLVVCSAGTLSAEESARDDGWKFGAELYFWGASVGGKSASGSAYLFAWPITEAEWTLT